MLFHIPWNTFYKWDWEYAADRWGGGIDCVKHGEKPGEKPGETAPRGTLIN